MSRPLTRRPPLPDPEQAAREDARLEPLRAQLLARLDRLAAELEAKRLEEDFQDGVPLVLYDIC